MIHPLSDVKTKKIGQNTTIWQYAIVLEGAIIGSNCNINCHTFIESKVIIGDNVTIKSGVYLWDGMVVHDNAFIGPNVTFTNDKFPRSKKYPEKYLETIIGKNASIGAAAIILGGVRIGEFAMIGAGAVVTKNVPDFALVTGSPARIAGWVDKEGNKLEWRDGKWHSVNGQVFIVDNNLLKLV